MPSLPRTRRNYARIIIFPGSACLHTRGERRRMRHVLGRNKALDVLGYLHGREMPECAYRREIKCLCTHAYSCIRRGVHVHKRTHVLTCSQRHVHKDFHLSNIDVHVHVCVRFKCISCICVGICMYVYVCIYICMRVCICMHMYMYVHTYAYMCTYVHILDVYLESSCSCIRMCLG